MMGKNLFLPVCAMSVILSAGSVYAASLSEWFQDQSYDYKDDSYDEYDEPANNYKDFQDTEQVSLNMKEEKIISPAFGVAVGKTAVPEGWTIAVKDLDITTGESISCPNAISMTVTSPDGKCVMKYISRRQFLEKYQHYQLFFDAEPLEIHTSDDAYDFDTMMHTLDYRDAAGSCDLMAGILFGGNPEFVCEWPRNDEENEKLGEAKNLYDINIRNLFSEAARLYNTNTAVEWNDLSQAVRTYQDGDKKMTLMILGKGTKLYRDYSGTSNNDVYEELTYWDMYSLYGLWTDADVHESYIDVFNAFAGFTAVSKEYEEMRTRNNDRLSTIFAKEKTEALRRNTEEMQKIPDEIKDDTINSGDTYSSFEAWDDYIRDETAYTDSEGNRFKLPDTYEHVYEGDYGIIYAGDSLDGPGGSTELE